MAKRVLVTRVMVGTTCDMEIYNNVREFSKKSGIPISKITDKAYEMFLSEQNYSKVND